MQFAPGLLITEERKTQMVYKVTINYTAFKFEDANTAINFAAIAKTYCAEDKVNVEVELLKDEEELKWPPKKIS